MSAHDRFRGQDLYNEHDDDDDPSAMQQDQGGRVPDHDADLDYTRTPGWDDHPSDVGSGAPPPPPAPEWDADSEDETDDEELAAYELADDDQIADEAPESDW